MAKLKANTIVAHPDTGVPTVLLEGETIPDWAKGIIGAHLGGSAPEADTGTPNAAVPAWAQMLQSRLDELLGHDAAQDEDADTGDDGPDSVKPGGSASREDWAAYAQTKGATEDELKAPGEGGLTRDQLRDKYGA